MAFLIANSIAKSFGDTLVLESATLTVNAGERVGLVGSNGVGKSTLLRILTGAMAADSGTVTLDPTITMGYLAQELGESARTIAQMLDSARGELNTLLQRMRELEAQMADAHTALAEVLEEYALVSAEFERRGGYAAWESDAVLQGLGLGAIERSRAVSTLSGGEKARLALALLLLRNPDLLLLDEPTNHLDMAALTWLEEFLTARSGALVVVSHDRYFLDHTVTRIVEIDEHSRTTTAYAGNYSDYAAAKAQARVRWLAEYEAQQEEMRALRKAIKGKARQVAHNRPPSDGDGFIYAFKGGRVDATVARNVRAAEEKLARIEADPIPKPPRPLAINPDFQPSVFGSRQPLVADGITHAYDGQQILDDIRLTVERGARVVIFGANGAGKSTLLKIMAGIVKPDAGSVHRAPGVIIGHLDQEQETLTHSGTLYDVYAAGLIGDFEQLKTELLGTGLFTWSELSRPVAVLSVGQRRKLQVARLLAIHANLLLLDEPTNHISLDVLEEFEAALQQFAGPIVAISHDRRFIERFAQEVWEIRDGQLHRFLGRWRELAERLQHAEVVS